MQFKNILRPLNIYYILVTYVFAAAIWWTILHLNNAETIRKLSHEKEEIAYQLSKLGENSYHENSPTSEKIEEEYTTELFQIFGEGIVFFLILILGSYQIHSGMRKELLLNRQQRNFLLSITHELKSPIAGLKISIETLLNRKNLEEKWRTRLLNNAIKDTERLKNLVDNILMAAKIENQSISFTTQEINLSQVVEETTRKLKDGIGRNVPIRLDVQKDVYVIGDPIAITSMVINLIENAIKYSPVEPEIDVKIVYQNKKAHFSVADNGIGISDEDKRRIFDKFYRVGSEDTRKTKGTGLGLFLVQQLTEYHNGQITVTDNKPKGSIFSISLAGKISEEIGSTLDDVIYSKNKTV